MTDIEVVIKIPEWQYKTIKENKMGISTGITINALCAIQQGIPLPKGHGRLIDADELKRHKYHDNNRFENEVAVAQIDWADTIIAADKEQEDGK